MNRVLRTKSNSDPRLLLGHTLHGYAHPLNLDRESLATLRCIVSGWHRSPRILKRDGGGIKN